MIRPPRLLRSLVLLGSLALVGAKGSAATDQKFTTPPSVSQEAITVVQLLEQAHYNRDAVGTDYSEVIPDYMSDLDGQHLFFLNSDKTKFVNEYAKNVYQNVRFLGNIDPAYDIFYTYESRVRARVNWIFDELKKNIDLSTNETYRIDRTKSEWPSDLSSADDLWRKRLKYELIAEMLSAKDDKAKSATAPTTGTIPAPKPSATKQLETAPTASAAASPSTSVSAAKPAAVAATTPPQSPLEKAKETIRKRYERMLKNMAEIDQNDLSELYLGAIARLYDPHTDYFSAETYQDFAIQMKLQLVGIGALLGLEDDNCVVKEIVPGGPADLGHQLKPNDKIIAVAQPGQEPVEVIGMKLRKIVDMIRGHKGTKVHLIVQPADSPDSSVRRDIVITRDVVKLNAQRARAAVFQLPDGKGATEPIGVITLPAFYGPADDGDTDGERISASHDVARLLDDLKQQKIRGLVLDLRHNGGGYLTEAIDLAGLFIPRGPVVQVKNYNGEIQVDNDDNPSVAYAGPMAVLVDRFSASASEIVTGALQNYGRAVIVGDSSTHGKGTVQQVVELKQINPLLAHASEPAGAVKFTIQKYYLPSGTSTQLKGVIPDIVLPSIDDYIPGIGEADLPHALVWDQIPSSMFDGHPLAANVVQPLREASLERQKKLEEFAYLRKNVDWFKVREQQKLISVNLAEREKQKAQDEAFRKEMKQERNEIAKSDFTFKPFYLGTPPPPKIKAPKSDDEDPTADDELDDSDTYLKADVHLREAIRIVGDAIALGQNRKLWVSNHPPLTVAVSARGR
ncbi:MAG TPA: carboxy terminal-processing peptidase [Opitutaceae bacterium]|nr:carboxy terminal-processing peptidase [Opitutaceae bacterium]